MLFIITTVLIFFVYKLKGSLANSTCDIQWFLCPFTNSSQDNVYRNNEELITEYLQSNCQTLIRLGTVLASIIQTNISEVSDTLYYDQNLASIPDIFVEGKEYYTYWYIGQFVSPQYCSSIQKNDNGEIDISLLRFRGINYSPEFYFNGVTLSDPSVPSSGMFHPYTLNISPYLKNDDVLNSISVLVHPPAYLGSALDGGQGGDHEIARNGAVMQCTLGWDWIQATPDRNTGIWDRVDLTSSGYVTIENSYMFTDSIQFDTYSATVIAESTLVNRHPTETMKGIWRIIILSDRGDLVATTEVLSVEVFPGSSRLMVSAPIQISGVTLWWPHTHGLPYLYTVQISFTLDAHSTPSHSIEFKHGVRTVTGYIDSVTKGWAFKVNNVSIFLVGGNWIATDQLVRYSNGDELSQRRYRQEVGLHAASGLNIIRVWGGGLAEREEFYQACDELGVLVHQEFWMTGDNNGRWAGSYDWPDNQQSYIDNARATILALRPHASLLLLCGGNELSPANQSPPPYIAANLQNLITILDSKRFYIPSSMSPQTADPNEYDPQYALSCQDGPYGILFPSQYYNERNPGEPLYTSSFISYQPEVGSVSMPVLRSLKRFLPPESLIPGAVPHYLANDKDVPEAWQYHKYLPFTTDTYDHIYAYSADYQNGSDPNTLRNLIAKEFAMRAQIIQLQQYQALYEGFSLFQWRYYSAVLLWKSQSPWPALRGALYDYYLDYTGGYWGVRNALSMYSTEDICMGTSSSTVCVDSLGMISSAGLHAMFNPTTRQVSVINRHAVDSRNGVAVRVSCFDLYGKELSSHVVSIGLVPSNGVVTSDESITWPAGLDNKTVVLFFLELVTMNSSSSSSKDDVGAKVLLPNLYWLSSPSNGDRHDYSQLGKLQLQTPAQVTSTVKLAWTRSSNKQDSDQELLKLGLTGAHLVAAQEPIASARYSGGVKSSVGFSVIEISCSTNSPAVAFMMQLTLLTSDPSATDPRVLPTFFSLNYITLRPGESVYVVVASSTEYSSGSQILEIDGWNVPTFTLVA